MTEVGADARRLAGAHNPPFDSIWQAWFLL
jgi:hypothetical protein